MSYTVVVALDGSTLAERALEPAADLAREHQGRLLLVRVLPPALPLAYGQEVVFHAPVNSKDQQLVDEYLKERAAELEGEGLNVATSTPFGLASNTLIDICKEEKADLLCLTTHGRSGFARWLLGSTTEEVLRGAELPILVVRSQSVRLKSLRKILVPLDGSQLSGRALDQARGLARASGATLVLCRVLDTAHLDQTLPSVLDGHESQLVEVRSYLDETAAALRPEFRVETLWQVGSPARALLEVAQSHNVDLIVMSTHGHRGFQRFICGSVAENVVRGSVCPVMLVPSRAPK